MEYEWKLYIENRKTKINKIILAKLDELIKLKDEGNFKPCEVAKPIEEKSVSNNSDDEHYVYNKKKKSKAELEDMFSF